MANKTIIAWTDHTFNIAWGCQKVSPGCAHCYAETLSARFGFNVWGPTNDRRVFGPKHWADPERWNKQAIADGRPHRVFSSSMCDIFEDHPTITRERERLWDVIRRTPHLEWQLLTKRAERLADNLPADWGKGYPNVWLGVSVEDQEYADLRVPLLRQVPAAVRFISAEPLLGPVTAIDLTGIHWIIVGGESGPDYRPMPHEWAEQLRQLAARAGVSFFFKQSAALRTEMGIRLNGELIREFPR